MMDSKQTSPQASQMPQTPLPPQMSSASFTQSTSVDIYDQVYRLRGSDPAYIQLLAQVVDGKMRAVSAGGRTVDSLRVAVLAALNLADELESLRKRYDALAGNVVLSEDAMRSRAGSLAGLLDEVIDDRKAG